MRVVGLRASDAPNCFIIASFEDEDEYTSRCPCSDGTPLSKISKPIHLGAGGLRDRCAEPVVARRIHQTSRIIPRGQERPFRIAEKPHYDCSGTSSVSRQQVRQNVALPCHYLSFTSHVTTNGIYVFSSLPCCFPPAVATRQVRLSFTLMQQQANSTARRFMVLAWYS